MATVSLKERVEALEAEVARLKAKVDDGAGATGRWWEQMWGAFAGDPAFEEATRLGRKYRESQRPKRVPSKRR